MIVRNTKVVDSRNRVILPTEWANKGDEVYFDITKAGHLIIRKVKKENTSNGEEKNVLG